MSVNYYNRYIKMFEFGKRVQKQFVKMNPRNFYRISRYEYSDGDVINMPGNNASLIFVIGTHDDKINCIKLNELLPDMFIRFAKTLIKNGITDADIDSMESFSEIVLKTNITGNVLFEEKIKGKPIYNAEPRPYRTYNLDGLKYIQRIELKKELLKTLI